MFILIYYLQFETYKSSMNLWINLQTQFIAIINNIYFAYSAQSNPINKDRPHNVAFGRNVTKKCLYFGHISKLFGRTFTSQRRFTFFISDFGRTYEDVFLDVARRLVDYRSFLLRNRKKLTVCLFRISQ